MKIITNKELLTTGGPIKSSACREKYTIYVHITLSANADMREN